MTKELERLLELWHKHGSNNILNDCDWSEFQSLKSKLEQDLEKAEKWDKYSQLLESIIKVNSDCKTLDEFILKYQLPKLLITVLETGKIKIEQLKSNSILEQQNQQLKGLICSVCKNHVVNECICSDIAWKVKIELDECIKEREEARKLFLPDLTFINKKIEYLQKILDYRVT